METTYLAIDFETPNRNNDRICSVGLSLIDSLGVIQTTEEILVNPECEFDSFNIELTGISPRLVSNAPTFPVVWEKLEALFCNNIIIAHNAQFDLSVLHKTLSFYNLSTPVVKYICTMRMAQRLLPCAENYKLNTLCNCYGIPLTHHRAGSDSFACARLFLQLRRLDDLEKNCIKEYDLNGPLRSRQTGAGYHGTSHQTMLLKELSSILKAISCDGILAEEEISFLINWMEKNQELKGNFPYDRIFDKLETVLEDGVVSETEKEELIHLFKVIDDPVKASCETSSTICLREKNICLSGEFDFGTKEEVSETLIEKGAVIQNSITKKTDILIVGGQGSSAWCSGNYGTKVKKAMELKEKGAAIQIYREADFFDLIKE